MLDRPPASPGGRTRLTCPRCFLTLTPRPPQPEVEMCPRCLARRHAVKLVRSTLAEPERESAQDGSVSASGLRLTVETRGDETVVRLAGALDIASAPVAVRTVAAADTREGPLLLDLSELSFMDSSGYGCLLRLRRDHGERLVFVPPPESVLRLFRQVGLVQHLGLDG